MTTRTTKTEYDYYEDGSVKRITITERDYADGGPVGPADLPAWRVGDCPPYRVPFGPVSTTNNGVVANIGAEPHAAIINGGAPTRVKGE